MYGVPGEGDFINFYRSESNQIWYAATLNHSQDYFWIYSKIMQFLSTFSYSDLGDRSYIFCVFRHTWCHTPSINYSPWFFLYLYKKRVDPYLKSLRRQKARPKSKKLIMFCLQLSEIKVSPQNLILFCLKSIEIKVSPHFVLIFGVTDHLKGGRTLHLKIRLRHMSIEYWMLLVEQQNY